MRTKPGCKVHQRRSPGLSRGLRLTLLVGLIQVVTACSLYTVQPINSSSTQISIQSNQFDQNFNPKNYVNSIWQSKVLPTVLEKSTELSTVLLALQSNTSQAEQRFAIQSSDGSYNFLIKGQATVVAVSSNSRNGYVTLRLSNYKGSTAILMQVGPVIFGTAIRDSMSFINFDQFSNQVQYQQVSDELNAHVAQVLQGIDIATLKNKTITFYGAFTFVTLQQVTITPIKVVVA